MTSLEQLHLFLKFHYAPWGAAKGEIWESCSNNRPYTEAEVLSVVHGLLNGTKTLTEFDVQMLRIVAEPGPPDDKLWAEKIRNCARPTEATGIVDVEASHADADRLLANLVKELGYDETAAAWQAVDKWYA